MFVTNIYFEYIVNHFNLNGLQNISIDLCKDFNHNCPTDDTNIVFKSEQDLDNFLIVQRK